MSKNYLQNTEKICNYVPALIIKFILPQLQGFVCSNIIDDLAILHSNIQHVICRIPLSFDIAKDKFHVKRMSGTGLMPCRKGNGGGMDNGE
jgi:hypothetical protein